jgi:hypothetical protein
MKTKQIMGILVVLMVFSILTISKGADRFYYGTYGGRPVEDFSSIRDSLRFNIVYRDVDSSDIQHWVANSLRVIVGSLENDDSPAKWATISHYTQWEAEGYPGSYYNLDYNGNGRLSWDPTASGEKARLFKVFEDPPGLIQTGPGYNQEPGIAYTAEFQIKSPDYNPPMTMGVGTPQNPFPPDTNNPVCSLKVVGNGDLLAHMIVYEKDFEYCSGYKTFVVGYYATQNPIEFQIYWFGNRTLYIDYVRVYDSYGEELIIEKRHDQDIMDYVSQEWVNTTLPNGDTVVYRWYLKDEPQYIDLFEPSRYIDSLLREVSSERVGFQAFQKVWDYNLLAEYFLRQNPEEYHVDLYPTGWWGPDSSGDHFQLGIDVLTKHYNESKIEANNRGKNFWVTIQGHFFGRKTNCPDTCSYGAFEVNNIPFPGWYCDYLKRPPTPNEVRVQTFLALCYGAVSILNFCYYSYNQFVYGDTCLMLGLYEHMGDSTTARWREIRDFTGPRVEELGPILNQLTWQGACFCDSVGSFVLRNGKSNYIDSIIGIKPDSTYIEVGFFDQSDTSYFMLVNRKCLETEHETLSIYFNLPDGLSGNRYV